MDYTIKNIEKKYDVNLKTKEGESYYEYLERIGLPSLVKLLKGCKK